MQYLNRTNPDPDARVALDARQLIEEARALRARTLRDLLHRAAPAPVRLPAAERAAAQRRRLALAAT